MRTMRSCALVVAAAAACGPAQETLQLDSLSGHALRTELAENPDGPVAAVHRVWTAYLESKDGRFDCRPSAHWLASEQGTWTNPAGREVPLCYDLAGAMIGAWESFEVLRIESVRDARDPEYRIMTRFHTVGSRGPGASRSTALVTVFAVRDGGEWKVAGGLDRLTRSWRRETVGPITYVVRPGHEFSGARARQAVAFADSLADAFGVPRLGPLRYYIVADGDEMLRITGYQPDTTYGTPGGRSLPGIIISGDPAFAEMHGHEIVHHVLQSLQGPRLHVVASEGVPTWLGGTRGMRYPDALRALRAYLAEHPAATLDTVIADNGHAMHNPGAALLAEMVHEHGGVAAIRRFLDSGPSLPGLRTGVEEILSMPWPEIAREWKRRALADTR